METIDRKIVCPNCEAVMPVRTTTGQPVKEVTCTCCGARLGVKFLSLVKPKQFFLRHGGTDYPLNEGQNTIGRMASTSEATVQIATDSKKISRMHAVITVSQADGQQAVLSNWHNKNSTAVNGCTIGDGDSIVLHNGDKVMMGDVELTFIE